MKIEKLLEITHNKSVIPCFRMNGGEQIATPEGLSFGERCGHMAILGPTGCEKTSAAIFPLCCQDIYSSNMGVTIMEPKGYASLMTAMMAHKAGRPYLLFDPTMKDCPFFNPLEGGEEEVIDGMAEAMLVSHSDSPQFFKDINEFVLRNALIVLKRLDKHKGVDGYYSTLIKLSAILRNLQRPVRCIF